MSLFNTLRRALGVNAGDDLQDETQMNPFDQAGLTGDETTGTVTGATNVNTGALPQNVVDNATQTQTTIPTETTGAQATGQVAGQGTQTGTGTKPPPLATPGIVGGGNTFSPQFIAGGGGSGGGLDVRVLPGQVVTTTDEKGQKSKSIQDLIEIGGTGFDDEVLARKLRRQAAMPELKNEDYYPNQPFTQAQTAWGDPIFSGAGALFPMAAYDAQRKARAQAEIDEAKRNVMQIKIPEIKTGAYVQRFRDGYTQEVMALVDEATKATGGNRKKAYQYLTQTGKLDALQNRYEGVARSIDQTADRAKEFLKNAQEKSTTMYFSPEGVRAATNFMNGMDAFSKGEITPDQLNQLEQQFRTAERWDNYKERNMKLLTADEKIPTAEQMNAQPSQEDMASYQEQLKLPNATQDYQTWIFVKKYTDLNKKKVMEGIVLPFFSQNPTAMEQLANENETPAQTADRIAESILALRGREIEVGQREKNPSARTNINITSGGTTTEEPYYETINAKRDEIIGGTKDAIDKINKSNLQGQQRAGALQGTFKNMFRGISDQGEVTKGYVGFEPVNVKPYNFEVQPSMLKDYMVFDAKSKTFRNANDTDFRLSEDKDENKSQFNTRSAGGNLVKQEIVLMTPTRQLVAWDAKDIPAGSELFVLQEIVIDYEPKGTDVSGATKSAKSKTVYSIGPITQNFKVADETFQRFTKEESTKGQGQPFKFGK